MLALGAVIVATLLITGRALFAIVVDEEAARVSGIPVDLLNTVLAILAAVVIVAAMQVVGILLIAALMVLPVGASQLVARLVSRDAGRWPWALGWGRSWWGSRRRGRGGSRRGVRSSWRPRSHSPWLRWSGPFDAAVSRPPGGPVPPELH